MVLVVCFNGCRGNAMPLIIVIGLVFFLVLVVAFGVSNTVLSEVNDLVQNDDSFVNESKTVMQSVTEKNGTVLDNAFAFLYAGLVVGAFLSGFATDRTPVFLLLTIVLLFATGYVGGKISNFYDEFDRDAQELALAGTFPKAHFIMSYLPLFIVGLVFVFGVGIILRNNASIF